MIFSLEIQNYLLIEKTHVEFHPHFNVITGETGSGKSMLISALSLLLSSKLTDDVIRKGADNFSVTVSFFNYKLTEELNEEISEYLGDEELLVIRRSKKLGSPSVCSINGSSVPQKVVKDVLSELVYFSSQREQNMLLKPQSALRLLDGFASLFSLSKEVKQKEKELLSLKASIDALKENIKKTEEEKDYLISVKKEIESISPKIGEDEAIKETLKNAKKSLQYSTAIRETLNALQNAETNALSYIRHAESTLSHLNDKDEAHPFEAELRDIDSAYQTLNEVASSLEARLKGVNLTDEELDALSERDSLLSRLKRKYGGTLENVEKRLSDVNAKLSTLESGGEELEALSKNFNNLFKFYAAQKSELFKKRAKAAKELDKATLAHLKTLEMPSCSFKTEVEEGEPFTEDKVTFMFSANEGEDLGDVKEISSGGELSRLFLSLISSSPLLGDAKTIIFDEIDTGLGGSAARSLSLYLKDIAAYSQVIAITHSALIASAANAHILVSKKEDGGRTYSLSESIDGEKRENEVARLLSGTSTKEALSLAKSMLQET